MSEHDQRPADVVPPVAVPLPEVAVPVPTIPVPDLPVPSVPTSLDAHAVAHGHLAEDVPIDGTMDAHLGTDGASVDGTGIVGDPDTSHLRVHAGASTQDGPVLEGDARLGDPSNHIDVAATTQDGGSVRAAASARDDQYTLDASGGVDDLGGDPAGHFRVDVNASPVPGMNLGLHGSGQNLGQPDASGGAQAYARLPLGDDATITANGGIAANQEGVTYQGGVALDARIGEHVGVGAGVQVSDADGDGRPDVAGQAGVTIR
ncbi:MAG: hypothetical protein AB7T06_23920 [Kofleriaceae bacterium]